MPQLDDEWNDALDEEYGDDQDAPEELEGEDEEAPEGEEAPEAPDASEDNSDEPEDGEDDDDESGDEPDDDSDDDTDDADGDDDDDEATPPAPSDEPEEKPATREEIKAALRELQSEQTGRTSGLNAMQQEVLETLYPEGVDRQLRDADGDPIKGIEDLTGVDPQTGQQVGAGLINPVSGEVFTEDEAGRYILRGQQKLNEQVQLMEDQAYGIAEAQLSLKESSERVEAEFGHILDSMPAEMNKQLADAYIQTLHRDPQSGMVVKAPLDAYEFYSIALAGAKTLAQAQPAAAPAAKTPPAKRTNKGDRADLSQRGTPKQISQDEKEWEEAFKEAL